MLVQRGFRTSSNLFGDFKEICERNGLSCSAALNRLIWLYVNNDSRIQGRVSDVTIAQQFYDAYGD